jgi:hypothetical protein
MHRDLQALSDEIATLRRRQRAGTVAWVALAAVALPTALFGGEVTLPHTFVNGTVADADAVNANFAAIEAAVDDNHARLEDLPVSGSGTSATIDASQLIVGDGGAELIRLGNSSLFMHADGTSCHTGTDNDTLIVNQDSASGIGFNTQDCSTRMYVTAGGDVGIGTTSPETTLDVRGAIRVGAAHTSTCDNAHRGAIFYDVTGEDDVCFCLQRPPGDSGVYEWFSLKRGVFSGSATDCL